MTQSGENKVTASQGADTELYAVPSKVFDVRPGDPAFESPTQFLPAMGVESAAAAVAD